MEKINLHINEKLRKLLGNPASWPTQEYLDSINKKANENLESIEKHSDSIISEFIDIPINKRMRESIIKSIVVFLFQYNNDEFAVDIKSKDAADHIIRICYPRRKDYEEKIKNINDFAKALKEIRHEYSK